MAEVKQVGWIVEERAEATEDWSFGSFSALSEHNAIRVFCYGLWG